MAGNNLNMAMEAAQDVKAADGNKLFVPQNWIKSKPSLKDIRAQVKNTIGNMRLWPNGTALQKQLSEDLAMNKEDFESRWTAD